MGERGTGTAGRGGDLGSERSHCSRPRLDRCRRRGLPRERTGVDLESLSAAPGAAPCTATATAPRDGWYVLAVLTVVYALNIAVSRSRRSSSRAAELRLSDTGIAFLTGGALAVF